MVQAYEEDPLERVSTRAELALTEVMEVREDLAKLSEIVVGLVNLLDRLVPPEGL